MKTTKKLGVLILLSVILCNLANAQIVYHNADFFPIIGKISSNTETRYERLPSSLKEVCREPVWRLGKSTAGLAIRFKTNSTSISAKWELLRNASMNHMTDVGIKGLDLYAWVDNEWTFVNSAQPKGKTNEVAIISNMKPQDREYMLYLPLYDGVTSLQIGIDFASTIEQPAINYPDTSLPVVVYGTSITQGGCATRPGMAYTNILGRLLNKEIVNLGFSGNGRLDYEIAELMSTKKEAALFVLDFVPNNTPSQILERTIPFVNIIREKNPETPILLIESANNPKAHFDQNILQLWHSRNNNLRVIFEELIQSGAKNLYYLEGTNLIGNEGEATVDGTHYTDVGFLRTASIIYDKIKTICDY